MEGCYFDTSVFIAVFKGESNGPGIRGLLRELRRSKIRIYTSIITIQEASVAALQSGGGQIDFHSPISKLARIQTITREIALSAAKLEGQIIAAMKSVDLKEEERIGINRRRKWDCFHIATALSLGCRTVYCCDGKMLGRGSFFQLQNIEFREPIPFATELFVAPDTPFIN